MRLQVIELAAALLLAVAVVGSAIWVVGAKHEARQLFAELEELKREKDRLQVDWGRLQLEEGTLATHPRIESLAREQGGLSAPSDARILIVAEPGL